MKSKRTVKATMVITIRTLMAQSNMKWKDAPMWICNRCNKEWGSDDFAPDLCKCGGEVKFIEPQAMAEINKVLDDAFQKVFGEKW